MEHRDGTGPAAKPQRAWLAWLPVLWVANLMASAAYGVAPRWQATLQFDMPDLVIWLLYAELVEAAALILVGLYLLGLAWRGSPRFASWFTGYIVAALTFRLGYQAVTLSSDIFVQTAMPWLITIGEVVIGILMIGVARRHWRNDVEQPPVPDRGVPMGVYLINGFLGGVFGAMIGAVLCFAGGAVIVEILDVSCFEGACGYAAAAFGLLGMIVLGVAGLVWAMMRTDRARRRSGPPTADAGAGLPPGGSDPT